MDLIFNLVSGIRREFEGKTYNKALLKNLYLAYNPAVEFDSFLEKAEEIFPKGNCGLTAVYLREKLGGGEVVKGFYNGQPHTFLLFESKVIDITADQFGGPPVYTGGLGNGWTTNKRL